MADPPDRRYVILNFKLVGPHDAQRLYDLYLATPGYFKLLGSKAPKLGEVKKDIEMTVEHDSGRRIELVYYKDELIGSLDYKLHFPEHGDLTINLLMIREDRQNQGLGEKVMHQLESRFADRTQRILASVLGNNPRGARFWERLDYRFELDARPIMMWYAKRLSQPVSFVAEKWQVAG